MPSPVPPLLSNWYLIVQFSFNVIYTTTHGTNKFHKWLCIKLTSCPFSSVLKIPMSHFSGWPWLPAFWEREEKFYLSTNHELFYRLWSGPLQMVFFSPLNKKAPNTLSTLGELQKFLNFSLQCSITRTHDMKSLHHICVPWSSLPAQGDLKGKKNPIQK